MKSELLVIVNQNVTVNAFPVLDGLTAVLRSPEQAEDPFFKQHGANTATADVLDAQACAAVIRDSKPQTVVSFVGGKNEAGVRSDAAGNINIIDAVAAHAPQARLILVTSMDYEIGRASCRERV